MQCNFSSPVRVAILHLFMKMLLPRRLSFHSMQATQIFVSIGEKDVYIIHKD